ncbi:MAG: M48 family metallopeptidase [Hyphomonadaceae bacterium]|nr:M48 family metallopeptidase [Hyphomonadaceae bacterium]
MFQAYGLYGHIQANRIRSVILLAGFVVLLHVLLFSILLIWSALYGGTFDEIVAGAVWQFRRSWPIAMLGAAIWFVIAYFTHQTLISMATGAHSITRSEAPKLYNVLENLCISRGLPMPALQIIDTPALNAYASGLREGQYLVAVTRGLLDTLADDELEAVLAHELTHIRNRDTQLMVVAVIFAGIFAFFGDMIIRGWDFPYGWSPTPKRQRSPWEAQDTAAQSSGGWTTGGDDRGDRPDAGGRSGGGGGAAIVAIAIAIAIILITWGVSTLIRFALSRSREFLADAGSAELTKNPDALIRALRKIQNHATFDVPSRMEAFFIENPVSNRLTGLLATHPSIDDRVEALRRYAGALDAGAVPQPGPRQGP